MKKILNIAAGKQKPLDDMVPNMESGFIVNMDSGYFDTMDPSTLESYLRNQLGKDEIRTLNCNCDVIEFMERTSTTFDHVVIYRFLEHISFTQVDYFIYLVSTVIKKGGIVDIIVPNYITLAKMILCDDPYSDKNFAASNILLTTELLNEPSCPHASIWTPIRAKYFWELEGRFKVYLNETEEEFLFDGRDIYMRFFARRV